MKKKILSLIVPAVFFGAQMFQTGCVKEDFDKVPILEDSSSWVKTVTIEQVKGLFSSPNNPTSVAGLVRNYATNEFWDAILAQGAIDSSIIFEGYVISCDSTGNFYEVVTIMDETGGIDLKINSANLYLTYGLKPGKKVLVKINDLAINRYRGTYQLGLPYTDGGVVNVTGVEFNHLPNVIQRSGKRITLQPVDLTITEVSDLYLQKLVRINNVQFWDPTKTYSVPGVNTNRTLIDCDGNRMVLRNSGYATFSNDLLPSGNGSITAVLSKYDATYQLYIRDPNDIQFTGERCGATAPTPNSTIAELKALCTSNFMQISQDIVIEGVVNANDESGNLYKQLFIFDESAGLEFKVDIAGLYTDFPVGTKIVVNCNGLYLGKYGQVVQLGGNYQGSIGRLSADIFYSKTFIVESGLTVTPVATSLSEISDNLLGQLITISNVQFTDSEMGLTYAESSATTNRNLEDFDGNTIIVRTSSYADFAGIKLPEGKGTITAVLSRYNSDYQLYIRSLIDVRMNQPRWIKDYMLNQTFNSATLSQPITVDGWKTIAVAGSKVWVAKEYPTGSGAKYAEMNPYQSGESSNIGWLVSPKVTLPTGTPFLSFSSQFGYWANSTLEAFISTDFDGTSPATATWVKITDARIVQLSDGQNTWIKSGLVDLSSYSGDIYIGFKYTGGGTIGQTTAFRIDDVSIFTQQ